MKTNIRFWSHLAQFFFTWEMFQIKVVHQIKMYILCSITFFNHVVYGMLCKITVQLDKQQMTCWVPNATNTHSEYVILPIAFGFNNDCTNVPQCYVICTLLVLLCSVLCLLWPTLNYKHTNSHREGARKAQLVVWLDFELEDQGITVQFSLQVRNFSSPQHADLFWGPDRLQHSFSGMDGGWINWWWVDRWKDRWMGGGTHG